MTNEGAVRAARWLMEAHASNETFRSCVDEFGIGGIDDAYAIQAEYVRLQKQSRSVGVAGYKVGLTSKRMQHMCRIDSPIAGAVLADRLHTSGDRLKLSDYGRLGVEFEIAVRMARGLETAGGTLSRDEVAAAVDAVCAAVEVVDDRGCDYKSLDVLSLVADNSWNAGVVLGPWHGVWPDLSEIEGAASENGHGLDKGFGRDVLGHPFHSVAWLAGHLAKQGGGLKAGDIVMTGSLVTTKFPSQPCGYRFDLGALGSVEFSVEI